MDFSARLQKLRKDKSVLQKDISAFVGVSVRSYQRYEDGTREPAYQKLLDIADYFDVSTDYLLGRTDNPNSHKI